MTTKTHAERCAIAQQCVPPSAFRAQLTALHDEMLAAVAAERERWAAPVRALLAAHDASLMRVGEMMRAHGVTTLRIGGDAQAELDAIETLRGLENNESTK